MKFAAVALLLTVSSVPVETQTAQSGSQQIALVNVDRIGEATARSFFVFPTSVRNYAIRHDGLGEGSTLQGMRKTFVLRMGGTGRLQRLYFAEYEGDLLLEYEVTGPRGNWGYVLRMDQKKMKFRWITPVSGDNLGPGLIDHHDLYFGASNLLAKIDLHTGAYLWQQSELQQILTFGIPAIKADTVVFRDEAEIKSTIEVEKQTGRITNH